MGGGWGCCSVYTLCGSKLGVFYTSMEFPLFMCKFPFYVCVYIPTSKHPHTLPPHTATTQSTQHASITAKHEFLHTLLQQHHNTTASTTYNNRPGGGGSQGGPPHAPPPVVGDGAAPPVGVVQLPVGDGRALHREWEAWKASDEVMLSCRVCTPRSMFLLVVMYTMCIYQPPSHTRQQVHPHHPHQGTQWLEKRATLPIYQIRDDIITALTHHDVIVVMGDTGCGKTTQVPQYLLEAAAEGSTPVSVVVTQPRRIAAMSVAERVAEERGEEGPGVGASRV